MAATIERLLDELGNILEEERRALLSGTAELISAAAQRKLVAAEAIETASTAPGSPRPEAAALTRLARYNQENEVICTAMLRHLTAALDHLRRHDLHRSYNRDGSEQAPPTRNALGAA